MNYINHLNTIFQRDLEKLKTEINAYQDETKLWVIDQEIKNCGGNLCLHLVGNLNTFIGGDLGNTGYVRQRDLEFSQKDVSRETLIDMVGETQQMIDKTLKLLAPERLDEMSHRSTSSHKEMTIGFFLMHLATHLAYHLGQVNYHRRLLDQA